MKRVIKAVLIVFLIGFIFFCGIIFAVAIDNTSPTPVFIESPTPTPTSIDEKKLFDLVQRWRFDSNLQPYSKSNFLCTIANKRLKEIKLDYSHNGFWKYAEPGMGENLANQWTDEQSVLDAWLESSGHRANLDRNYTHSCLKCENNYCVHIFGYY